MTKAEIVAQISRQSGIEKTVVMTVVESFMENVKESMVAGNEVFLRGFGSFIIKRRAERRTLFFQSSWRLLSELQCK